MTETARPRRTNAAAAAEPGGGAARTPRKRMTRRSWIDAALEMLVDGSVESVRVEVLAERLGITRGSFYRHFKDRDDLLNAITDHWVHHNTLVVIRRIDAQERDPKKRLLLALEVPFNFADSRRSAQIELAMRCWARRAPSVQAALERIDALRLAFLEQILMGCGLDKAAASVRAYVAYSFIQTVAYVGTGEQEPREAAKFLHRALLSA